MLPCSYLSITNLYSCQGWFRCTLPHIYTCRTPEYSDTPGWHHCRGYRWRIHRCLRRIWRQPTQSYTDIPAPCHKSRRQLHSYKASYNPLRSTVHHILKLKTWTVLVRFSLYMLSKLIRFRCSMPTSFSILNLRTYTCASSPIVFQEISHWTGAIIRSGGVHTVIGEGALVCSRIDAFIHICKK